MDRVSVLGAGAWGTALACHLAKKGISVRIWSLFERELAEFIRRQQSARNGRASDAESKQGPLTESSLSEAVAFSDTILVAVPGRFFHTILQASPVIEAVQSGKSLINAGKGLCQVDSNNWAFASETYADTLGNLDNYISITGPTFASEIALERYSALLVSGQSPNIVAKVQGLLQTPHLHACAGDDLLGAEIGGVLKNGYAILTGACAGLGSDSNTYSAVLVACLKEMRAFGAALGAKDQTFFGLAGIGDLVLTTGSEQSRNYRLGYLIARGATIEQAQKEIGQETEGYHTAQASDWMSSRAGHKLDILSATHDMLSGRMTAGDIVARLFGGQLCATGTFSTNLD